ncbi:MAG TPA: lipopolysaccharide biosynthesis protein, partial [Sphingopyxis sp.]|nr:lipopolysaccharide biosynthesis protein [Sphingopyxis sp.]
MAIAVGFAGQALAALGWAPPIRLLLLVGLGVALYGALLWLLEREAIAEVLRLILRRQPPVEEPAA